MKSKEHIKFEDTFDLLKTSLTEAILANPEQADERFVELLILDWNHIMPWLRNVPISFQAQLDLCFKSNLAQTEHFSEHNQN